MGIEPPKAQCWHDSWSAIGILTIAKIIKSTKPFFDMPLPVRRLPFMEKRFNDCKYHRYVNDGCGAFLRRYNLEEMEHMHL
jgi:hypothetical protein